MADEDYNPSAFPVSTIDGYTNEGMSLRDWLAGQALVGGLAAADNWNFATPEQCARQAYSIADAMLTERAKGAES